MKAAIPVYVLKSYILVLAYIFTMLQPSDVLWWLGDTVQVNTILACDPPDPSNNPTNAPESEPPVNECSPSEQGNNAPASSGDPVLIRRGASLERALDLRLSSPTFDWYHKRAYQSDLGPAPGGSDLVAIQGERWTAGLITMFITQEDVDSDSDDDIVLYMDATSKRTFINNGTSYDAPGDMSAKLTHDATNDEYVIEYTLTGDKFIFHDFTVATTDMRGIIKARTDRYGEEELTFTFNDTSKRISQVSISHSSTAQSAVVNYSYYLIGDDYGRIKQIDVRESGGGGPVIQRARYTYWSEDVDYSDDLGSLGDLIMVEVFRLDTNDSPTTPGAPLDTEFGISLVTQYRYAANHKLTHVFMPGDVERIMADGSYSDPEDIFEVDDTDTVGSGQQLQEYASRSYSYYSSDEDPEDMVTSWDSGGEDLQGTYIDSTLLTLAADVDETVDGGWVKSETVRGREMLTGKFCGNGISREYYYLQIEHTTDSPDKVSFIVVEDKVDTNGDPISRTVYGLNSTGHKLREVLIDDPTAATPQYWCKSEVLGTTGNELNQVKERRLPSAHNVTTAAHVRTFLYPSGTGNDASTLRDDDGAIYVYGYDDNGLQTSIKVQEGENGTAYYLSETVYGDPDTNDDEAIWLPVTVRRYDQPLTQSTSGDTTSFSYDFYDDDDTQLKIRTISLPIIVSGENGSGQATQINEYYDICGRLRWIKDGDGYVHYISYDPNTGGVAYVVKDVDTSTTLPSAIENGTSGQWLGWGSTSPPTGFTRATGLPDALHLAEEASYDTQGRPTMIKDAEDITTYIAYSENEVRAYRGFVDDIDSVTYGDQPGPLKPIVIAKRNNYGDVIERIEADPSGITINNPPTASETIAQSAYTSWIKVDYNEQSFPQTITRYHNIPSTTSGSLGSNYYQTWLDYDDRGQRTHIVEIISGTSSSNAVEQVTKLIYDDIFDRRVVEVQRYVSDDSDDLGSGFNSYNSASFKTLKKLQYDNDSIGDGYITRIDLKYGTGTNDYTGATLHRTFRGHLRGVEPFYYDTTSSTEANVGPYAIYDLNWEGVDTARALYDTEPTWTGSGGVLDNTGTNPGYVPFVVDDSNASGRRTLAKREFDALGRIYQTALYTIDSTNGSRGDLFEVNGYYDQRGNLVAVATENSAATEYAYDGAGRLYQRRTALSLESTKYASGVYQYREPLPEPDIADITGADDQVIAIIHLALAGNGNIERFIKMQALHDDTDGIDTTNNDDYLQTVIDRWYDEAGRVTTVANRGSGDTTSGQGQFKYFSLPTRGTAPSASTDAMLVTLYDYDEAGQLATITDPKGLDNTLEYDNLGRLIKRAEYDSTPTGIRATLAQYNGLNKITALIADPDLDDTFSNGIWSTTSTIDDDSQVTTYSYGDDYNGQLLTEVKYPDSANSTDVVSLAYALDGRLTSRIDQRRDVSNSTTLTLTYNNRRDLEFQAVTDLISAVDDHVQSIKTEYDDLARMYKITSYSDTAGSGTIRNQVVLTYNDLGQLTKSQQSHEGAVTAGTPDVDYSYDLDSYDDIYLDGARLESITYPNGRIVHLQYGSTDSVWDRLSRVRGIYEDNGSGEPGTQLVSYDYLGMGRSVQTDYLEPDLRLDHHRSDSDGDYEGLDRFGRIKDHLWDGYNSTSDADQFKYGYDYNSNRTWRENVLATGYDEFYTYDDLNRLDQLDRGTLTGTAPDYTGVTSPTFAQDWVLDDLGNWTTFKQDDDGDISGGWGMVQTRVHNDVNEIDIDNDHANAKGASISVTGGPVQFIPRYDAAGNMTELPIPGESINGYDAVYDAWNRIVEIKDHTSEATIATYEYDGLGRRIIKVTYDSGSPDETRHYYYSAAWRILEERVDSSTAADRQFVWGQRYIDDLILRDRDTDSGATGNLGFTGSGLDERLYCLQDANYNTTALTNSSGVVQERVVYTAYGTPTFLDSNWANVSTTSSKDWEVLFAGYRHDSETGLYQVRNRYYHAELGRWLSRDPLGYIDGMNLYEYVMSSPVDIVDPMGLQYGGMGGNIFPSGTGQYGPPPPGHEADVSEEMIDFLRPHPDDIWIGKDIIVDAFTLCGLSTMDRIGMGLGGTALVIMGIMDIIDYIPDPSDYAQKELREGLENAIEGLARRSTDNLPDETPIIKKVQVSKNKYPESYEHAESTGNPNGPFTKDAQNAKERRRENLKDVERVPGLDLDEWPPAQTVEGTGASVKPISPSDNRGSGATIGNQTRDLNDGDQFEIEWTE